MNDAPINRFSKKQATIETTTYGSDFIVIRICVKQSIYLNTTLCCLSVPIKGPIYMIGDKIYVVDSYMEIYAKLHKI